MVMDTAPGGRRDDELDPEVLLGAYRAGFFPMAEHREGPVRWFSPDPRAIIPLDTFRVPRSLRRLISSGKFTVRTDHAFRRVVEACARRDDTWISDRIIDAYDRLHRLGHAHSVESWLGGDLAGGLYGVSLNGAFFGESMFSLASGGSKVALVALVERLSARGFLLLDTQYTTPHLERFGAREIPRTPYLELLARALAVPTSFLYPGETPS